MNKPFCLNDFINYGIIRVNHIIDSNGAFLSYNAFCEKYFKCNFLQYYSLIDAIPKQWEYILRTHTTNHNEKQMFINVPTIMKAEKTCKLVKQNYFENNETLPTYRLQKWNRDLSAEISIEDFLQAFQLIYKITKSPPLQVLQYKLLHRTLVTNRHLFFWKIKDNDNCSFCSTESETYIHLFYECTHSRIYWNKIKTWVRTHTGINIIINATSIILGQLPHTDIWIEIVFLIAKKTLYQCSRHGTYPTIHLFVSNLKHLQYMERRVSDNNNTVANFDHRWGPINLEYNTNINNSSF